MSFGCADLPSQWELFSTMPPSDTSSEPRMNRQHREISNDKPKDKPMSTTEPEPEPEPLPAVDHELEPEDRASHSLHPVASFVLRLEPIARSTEELATVRQFTVEPVLTPEPPSLPPVSPNSARPLSSHRSLKRVASPRTFRPMMSL